MYQFNNEDYPQFIAYFDAQPARRKRPAVLSLVTEKGEVRRVNMFGDSYRKSPEGQITYFKFAGAPVSYTFTYDDDGEVIELSGSNGWLWTKSESGWVVRNCFDKWNVEAADCDAIQVYETGIKASGARTELMGLPERA